MGQMWIRCFSASLFSEHESPDLSWNAHGIETVHKRPPEAVSAVLSIWRREIFSGGEPLFRCFNWMMGNLGIGSVFISLLFSSANSPKEWRFDGGYVGGADF
jgi:hypothetical protein